MYSYYRSDCNQIFCGKKYYKRLWHLYNRLLYIPFSHYFIAANQVYFETHSWILVQHANRLEYSFFSLTARFQSLAAHLLALAVAFHSLVARFESLAEARQYLVCNSLVLA